MEKTESIKVWHAPYHVEVKQEDNPKDFWWSPSTILSYNCLFNWVIGNRGGGKSFGCKEMMIKAFFAKGQEFVYVRRTDTETKAAKKKFFDDIISENKFPGFLFREKNYEFQYIEESLEKPGEPDEESEWKTMGYAIYLSGARKQKSVPFPKVKYILFDEFIIPNAGIGSYLPDEVTCFLEMYETIARLRDVIVLFVSNAVTANNPYFLYFNLHLPYGSFIGRCGKDKCIEIVNNEAYKEKKRASRFGQMIAGTEYAQYAIENQFVWDSDDDIKKTDKNYQYDTNIRWNGKMYGCYLHNQALDIILSSKVDLTRKGCIEMNLPNGKFNRGILQMAKYKFILSILFKCYMDGRVLYDSKRVKAELSSLFEKLM